MFIKREKMSLVLTGVVMLFMGFATNVSAVYYNYWNWSTGNASAYGVDG